MTHHSVRACTFRIGRPVRPAAVLSASIAALVLLPSAFYAAGGGAGAMPWDAPLTTLLNALSGPTARIIAGLAFVIGGFLLAFSRLEEGGKRFAQVVIGIAIAIGAVNLVTTFAFAGAVLL
jgi:type IV secretory pathway VirB2 component (pilin)